MLIHAKLACQGENWARSPDTLYLVHAYMHPFSKQKREEVSKYVIIHLDLGRVAIVDQPPDHDLGLQVPSQQAMYPVNVEDCLIIVEEVWEIVGTLNFQEVLYIVLVGACDNKRLFCFLKQEVSSAFGNLS